MVDIAIGISIKVGVLHNINFFNAKYRSKSPSIPIVREASVKDF